MPNQITYEDKVDLNVATDVANINKVTAADMNEIKQVVNGIDDEVVSQETNIQNIINQINNPTYTTTEGTNLSIDNTRVGKMKFEYYGNMKQNGNPTPNNPIEIKTVTGENTIDIVEKNLFNPSNVYLGKAWNNVDNTARAIAYIPLTIGNTYTISIQNANAVDMVLYNFSDTSILPYSIAPNQITTTTTITATKEYLYFQFNKTNITKNDILAVGIQVEKGSTASTYEEFKSQSYELNLGGTQLIDFSIPLGNSNTTNSFKQDILSISTTSGTYANAYRDITDLYKNNSRKSLKV